VPLASAQMETPGEPTTLPDAVTFAEPLIAPNRNCPNGTTVGFARLL